MSDDEGTRATRSRSRGKSPPVDGADNTGNSLYAASLPLRLNKVEFEEMFSKYGPLVSCDLIEDPITHESRGFGFVVYEDKRDADDALKALHDKEVLGKRIRVEKSKRSKPHAKSPGHLQIWALRVPVPRLGRRTDRGTETTVPAIGHGTVGLRLGIGRVTVETGRLGIGRVTDGSVRVTVMETAATTVHGTDPVTAVIEDAII
ncbi:hypothetical protein H257_08159 [Aphanomyces astaci]|uniref:RRM domain-containing protein n=1 Tax=Aphanomyces astaci TaxID=112090 RepID=W4GG11_APHAT|nr:hypothetical protein H257_08159 [Aphanomyces astaci]ETV77913.1 hypothetical protein H257_08159 [Aphanomyces astaci]|eukprot:XP_009832250.1 hypothetical protein H257_08159 [Aphanomyces astaci]